MHNNDQRPTTLFPKWTNAIRPFATIGVLGGLVYLIVLIGYATSPETTNIGYAPDQPVPYSHALHVGELGLDCRYCHSGVEIGAKATIPPTQTCMNCHAGIKTKSDALEPVFASYATGMPLEWVRVHDLPDFVYFDHSAHVRRGVGCVSCHGRVDQMEVVSQVATLGMGWCLDCHRGPEEALRPRDKVTDMAWQANGDALALGERLRHEYNIQPPTDCSTCHR